MIADMVAHPARFDPSPAGEAGYEAARQQLRAAFTRWAETTSTELGPDSFEELVHYKWGHLDGHLTRWARADLDAVLLELFPARMIVDDDDLAQVIPETVAFIGFWPTPTCSTPAARTPSCSAPTSTSFWPDSASTWPTPSRLHRAVQHPPHRRT